jgi:mitotic-spindle organizing protein 1
MDKTLENRGEEVDSLHKLSTLLQTGLNKRTIALLLQLIEEGYDPEALGDIINQINEYKQQDEKK